MGMNPPRRIHLLDFRQPKWLGMKGVTITCKSCNRSVFVPWSFIPTKWEYPLAREYEKRCRCKRCGEFNAELSFDGFKIGDWVTR